MCREIKTKKTNIKQLKEKEYQQIQKKITPNDIVIILDEKGKMLNSIDFASEIKSYINTGKKRILFHNWWGLWFIKKVLRRFPH